MPEEQSKDRLPWGQQIAIMAAYAGCYVIIHYFTYGHWIAVAGLRVTCLLLLPPKFWLALAIGETAPVAANALTYLEQLGPLYVGVAALPVMVFCMPLVAAIKRRFAIYNMDGSPNMTAIFGCTFLCAVINAVLSDLSYITAIIHQPYFNGTLYTVDSAPENFLAYLLGSYLGALTVVPCVMALRERLSKNHSPLTWERARQSFLLRHTLFGTIPALAGILFLASKVDGSALMAARLALALPVIVMTIRHGWHGGALAGTLASIALASTALADWDPRTIQVQAILALVLSTLLLFGVRVARHSLLPSRVERNFSRHERQ